MPGYHDLEVYKEAYKLALELHRISRERLPSHEQMELASQIRWASKSIPINIAEGYGKRQLSVREFVKFLYVAMGSADEVIVELEFCRDLGYISLEEHQALSERYDKIGRQIRRLIESLRQ